MSKKQREQRQRPETLALMLMPVYEEKLEESLGNRLRELRRQQGLSLRALAEKSGLSANTLSLIENGKTSPSRIVAMSFCEPRSWTRVLSS